MSIDDSVVAMFGLLRAAWRVQRLTSRFGSFDVIRCASMVGDATLARQWWMDRFAEYEGWICGMRGCEHGGGHRQGQMVEREDGLGGG